MWGRLKVLLLLLLMGCKGNPIKCPVNNPLPIHHDWYQPGDLFIGAVVSHYVFMTYEFFFEDSPSRDVSYNLPL